MGKGDGHLVDSQDQRLAQERFHYGREDRYALGKPSRIWINRASTSPEESGQKISGNALLGSRGGCPVLELSEYEIVLFDDDLVLVC